MMTSFEEVLISRDGLTKSEARREKEEVRNTILEMLEDGDGYDDIEDFLMYDYGLEMDYVEDLLF